MTQGELRKLTGTEYDPGAVYIAVLTIHSWMRWVTLFVAAAATLNTFRSPKESGPRQHGWDKYFMLAVDLQALFGLVLYFGLSPYTTEAMTNLGSALRTPTLRYWVILHAGGMVAAAILVRVGRVLSLNASSGAAARRRRLVCFALATGVMLAAIPWPGLTAGRPLFRLGWRRVAVHARPDIGQNELRGLQPKLLPGHGERS